MGGWFQGGFSSHNVDLVFAMFSRALSALVMVLELKYPPVGANQQLRARRACALPEFLLPGWMIQILER